MGSQSANINEVMIAAPYQYYEQSVIRKIHHFYINEAIIEANAYTEMTFRIQTAGPDDVIYIHLNTPGGALHTGIQIINSMKSTQAHVICSIEGEVDSIGTMIFLAADEFVIHDRCMMMFHNYSGGVFGKGHEQIAALNATTKWVSEIMEELYIPFMSKEEFDRLEKGEDLYFRAADIRKRVTKMVKLIEKERKIDERLVKQK